MPKEILQSEAKNLHVAHSRKWTGYAVTLLLEAGLTLALKLLAPHIPLSNYPITYVLVIMTVAYLFGEGPAALAFVVGLTAFTYFFVHPFHGSPPYTTPEGWARLIAFLLGTSVVGFSMLLIRRSAQRMQSLAAGLSESNNALHAEIAERSRIERDLRSSEERYHTLFEGMSEGFAVHEIICDDDGKPQDYRFIEVNPAFEHLTGLKGSEVIGRTIREVSPDTEQYWIDTYGTVALTGVPAHFENYAGAFDKYFDVIAYSPVRGQFAVLFIDVTERSSLRRALATERDLLRAMMENTNGSFAYLDPDFNFVMVNSTYARDSGHSVEELIGRNHFELFPSEENRAIFRQVRETGVAAEYMAKPFEYPDQPWRGVTYWDWKLSPVKDASGHVQGLVIALFDVTDLKRTEAKLQALVDLLRLANEPQSLDALLQAIIQHLSELSGCEAIGVRLRDGDDFPYHYTHGLPVEFIDAENQLCAHTGSDSGNDSPLLECICGHVICGRSDPSVPYFTARGSFWTGDSCELAAQVNSKDRLLQGLRGRCIQGYRSIALVPMRTGGQTYGMIQLLSEQPDRINLHIVTLVEEVGDIVANVIARKHAETELAMAKDVAEGQLHVVQRALVPSELPVVCGYETASAYIPAFRGQEIGGDFYDVHATQDGRISVIIGDVSGKGIQAAARAAAARNTVHAFAYESSSPAETLTHANTVLCSPSDSDSLSFITIFLAVLDPSTGEFSYASAGHPPPAIRRADGNIEFLENGSLPVGVMEAVQYRQSSARLNPGDKLVLYTDGVSEARHAGSLFDVEGIERTLRQYGDRSAADVLSSLLSESRDWAEGRVTDDTAIIVIHRQ